LALGLTVVAVFTAFLIFENNGPGRPAQEVFVVLRGENILQIAANLKAEGYIKSKAYFIFRAVLSGDLKKMKAGKYDLKNLSDVRIEKKLALGQTVPIEITVIPGWSLKEIAREVDIKKIIKKTDFLVAASSSAAIYQSDYGFLADAPKGAGLEGYLYPDTYQIPANPEASVIIKKMLENFGEKLAPETRAEITKQGRGVFEIVTMASMLEKEVRSKEDKKIVAGILWKRDAKGWPLQVDSTLLYDLTGERAGVINKEIDSPYNTYLYGGLPKGPICNSGIESIEAAVYPTATDYLFYLSAKDGRTIFSKTYSEHLMNKAKYLDN